MKYSGHSLNYYVNYQNVMRLATSYTKQTLILVYKFRPWRENWFQYVRRVYATAINFPCIITLPQSLSFKVLI